MTDIAASSTPLVASPPVPPVAADGALPISLDAVTFLHPGERGIRDVTLGVARGETLGLLGPNGSGKSTVLSLVSGEHAAQAGEVLVFGQAPRPALRRRIGIVYQEGSLDPLMTPRETLHLHGRLFGWGGDDLRHRIADLLRVVNLDERRDDAVETLSGGMRRRLEIARAVLHSPELLLLDEPALGLDPESAGQIGRLLAQIRAAGTAILLSTNDVREAERNSDRVVFLAAGVVVAEGSPGALKQGLRHDAVEVEWPDAPASQRDVIAGWDGVGRVTWAPPILHATVDDASAFVPQLFQVAGQAIRGIRIRESTLEDAYFQLVGQPLDGDAA